MEKTNRKSVWESVHAYYIAPLITALVAGWLIWFFNFSGNDLPGNPLPPEGNAATPGQKQTKNGSKTGLPLDEHAKKQMATLIAELPEPSTEPMQDLELRKKKLFVVKELVRFGDQAREAAPKLRDVLRSSPVATGQARQDGYVDVAYPDFEFRSAIVRTLGAIDPDNEELIDVLLLGFSNDVDDVYHREVHYSIQEGREYYTETCKILGRFGPAAEKAIPVLLELMKGRLWNKGKTENPLIVDLQVRKAAAAALLEIAPGNAAVELDIKLCKSNNFMD